MSLLPSISACTTGCPHGAAADGPDASMILFENVSKFYKGDVVALRDMSAEVQKGEFLFLVGPSGSGKSTFLRLLLREESVTNGRIVVAGRDISRLSHWKVPQLRRNIGCVFQDFKLLPDQDRLRERRVRDGSDRSPAPRRAHAGPTGARPRRSGRRRRRGSRRSCPEASNSGSRSRARS